MRLPKFEELDRERKRLQRENDWAAAWKVFWLRNDRYVRPLSMGGVTAKWFVREMERC